MKCIALFKAPEPEALQTARKGLTKPFGSLASPSFAQEANLSQALVSGSATKSKTDLRSVFLNSQLPELAATGICYREQAHVGRAAAPPASPRSGSPGVLQFDTSHLSKGIASLCWCRISSNPDHSFRSRAVTHHRALQPVLSFHHSSRAKHVCTHVCTSI